MNDISKLPKWAQEAFVAIERQRDAAVRALQQASDNTTPSPIFYDRLDCTAPGGPISRRFYVPYYKIVVESAGICMDITTHDERVIGVSYGDARNVLSGVRGSGNIALIPTSHQSFNLVAPHNLRVR